MCPRNRRLPLTLVAVVVSALAPLSAQSEDDSRLSYSYVRTLEGRATLASYGNGPGEEADIHQILQRGDRIRVEGGARVEIALADRNLLRVGGGSDLSLVTVAFSADGEDRATRIDLDRGEIVLEVTEDALGDELPEIRTLSARVFVNEPGLYRVRTESDGYTELVVRSGYAELLTERGSTIVRGGEEAWTSGDKWQPVELSAAGPRDALERWSDELADAARRAADRTVYVEPELAYAAAPLADYGSWVSVDASWYWRPRVAAGWRPYYDGRWAWSPSGLTWVSSEPWGWVPYHYGTWCDLPGYGWAWRPGSVYAPAWVYWYWSDSWTGWCPMGYYTNYYRGYWDSGFRFGFYGWTGGHWGLYSHWNFGPTHRVCDRRMRGGWHHGDHVAHAGGPSEPNGILTTDTAGLPRDRWDRPTELVRTLERTSREGGRRDMPVVTDFVARKIDLPPLVDGAVRPEPAERASRRSGTPLDPGGVRGDSARSANGIAREAQPGWRSRRTGTAGPTAGEPADRGRPETNGRGTVQPTERGRSALAPQPGRDVGAPESHAGSSSGGTSAGRGRSDELSRNGYAVPPADDRQGWRAGGGAPPASGRATPAPGSRWQQSPAGGPTEQRGQMRGGADERQGVAPRPREQMPNSGQQGGGERATPAPRGGNAAPESGDRRYGYPAREIGGATPSAPYTPSTGGRPYVAGRPQDTPQFAPSAPVERVIGGVRRGAPEGGQPRSWTTPNPGYGQPAAPRYGSPTSPPARPAPGTGRATPPAGGGYAAPPRQAPTTPRAAPPGGGTVSGGSGRGHAPQGGGQRASPPPSSSSSSSSSSTPPPQRRPKQRGD